MTGISVLSLDLDWFNYIRSRYVNSRNLTVKRIRDEIDDFFDQLSKACVLPSKVLIVPEHHYLYPWANALAAKKSAQKINIVNIDEHHDFYNLRDSPWKKGKPWVDCTNFFGYMAHDNRLGDYRWVTNCTHISDARWFHNNDLIGNIKTALSSTIRQFRPKPSLTRDKFTQAVKGRKFDGFIIVRSAYYTHNPRIVGHAVDLALSKHLPRTEIKKHTHRREFLHGNLDAVQQLFRTSL